MGDPHAAIHHMTSFMDAAQIVHEMVDVDVTDVTSKTVHVPVVKGDFRALPERVRVFIAKYFEILKPKGVWICDGSEEEREEITDKLVDRGLLIKLNKMENCYACRTDPGDVARVESKTFMVTPERYTTVPHVKEGFKGILGQWMSNDDMDAEMSSRLPGSMQGRVMYVIPFSMGPIGGPLSKIGVQLTDFNYVVLSMCVMTRVSPDVWKALGEGQFVQCVHTIGAPRPLQRKLVNHWPGDSEHILIAHFPQERKIVSYGSGYGGNSLLGKKCFALRIAMNIAKDEGWLAEHMLVMGVTNPEGVEKFIVAAFPSACGKTNMAMLTPTLPGWKVRVVGDDIAWMRFNEEDGKLHAINPENGFFGVAPGTNLRSNPIAMQTVQKNSIFTNVGVTDDGGVFWEGMEKEVDPNIKVTTWLGEENWKIGMPGVAAHPNSRFCTPAGQCPIIHPLWEDPKGVPIDAIVFGGRRPEGVPLVFESLSWAHGVFVGAAVKSEATAAAEFKGKQIMHDPMAMRPFMGYNFGKYLEHWLNMEQSGRIMPKIFHVNWFRTDEKGNFLWPGFGENIRVIDWICRRAAGEENFIESPIGRLPREGSINMEGLPPVDWNQLFSLPKDYWKEDIVETRKFFDEQVGSDLPRAIAEQLKMQESRISAM